MNISVVYQDESDNIPPATKNLSGIPLVSIEITHEMVMGKLNALIQENQQVSIDYIRFSM